jgi:hypothetical protein
LYFSIKLIVNPVVAIIQLNVHLALDLLLDMGRLEEINHRISGVIHGILRISMDGMIMVSIYHSSL